MCSRRCSATFESCSREYNLKCVERAWVETRCLVVLQLAKKVVQIGSDFTVYWVLSSMKRLMGHTAIRIVSGGQTGADRPGLDRTIAHNIPDRGNRVRTPTSFSGSQNDSKRSRDRNVLS